MERVGKVAKRALRAAYQALLKPILRPIFRDFMLLEPMTFGDRSRVKVAPTAVICNAVFNTHCGTITIEDYVLFGTGVAVLTGTHDVEKFFLERMKAPASGRDIVICTGAWIASNAVVIGPCVVGEHSVVAAGAVVVDDVPPFGIVAGVPARPIGSVRARPEPREK